MTQTSIFEYEKATPIENLKVGSCFSGVGMWELGLKYLGIEYQHQFFIEWDKFPSASFKAIHGNVKNYDDVTKIQGSEVDNIDLFFYSPPCQAFSVAGKGLGAEEDRGLLFNDAYRIIKAKQPSICIMENVKGLTNKKHKEFFEHIQSSLSKAGYINYIGLLNTKNYGVPQNRERIFIVSIRHDVHVGYEFPEPFDNGLRLKDLLEKEVDEKYYISDEKCLKLLSQVRKDSDRELLENLSEQQLCKLDKPYENGKFNSMDGDDISFRDFDCNIAGTITARYYKGIGGNGDNAIVVPCITPDRVEKRQNGRRFKTDGDPMFTLTGQDRHGILEGIDFTTNSPQIRDVANCISARTDRGISNRKQEGTGVIEINTTKIENSLVYSKNELNLLGMIDMKGNEQVRRVYDTEGIAPTLNTMQGGHREPKVLTNFRIRKLTPKECWRLQGIKDEDFEKAQQVNSNSQLYKQAGNGVSVNVVMELIKSLKAKGYIK